MRLRQESDYPHQQWTAHPNCFIPDRAWTARDRRWGLFNKLCEQDRLPTGEAMKASLGRKAHLWCE